MIKYVTDYTSQDTIQQIIDDYTNSIIEFLPEGKNNQAHKIKYHRNNVTLRGYGTRFRMNDRSNLPNLLVRSEGEQPILNIKICGILFDGNRENQTDENASIKNMTGIKNNNVECHNVRGLFIADCTMQSARSGGLVLTNGCQNAMIISCKVRDAFYDGFAFAGHDTSNIRVENFVVSGCMRAGVSLDTGVNSVWFKGGQISRCGHAGIFVRWCKYAWFVDIGVDSISKDWIGQDMSHAYGVYLHKWPLNEIREHHVKQNTWPDNISFSRMSIQNVRGVGIFKGCKEGHVSRSEKTVVFKDISVRRTEGPIEIYDEGVLAQENIQ
ncbi:hypothetical protein AKO1_013380 [Acrasis kona]|uniref:Right handed beta helix domain-containing protein n=1 Tax=Acrasis kona TaxID=1008807 RepID=A0AAW2YZS2_9EUKA